ncbi:MAG TPA: phosphate signaling complex protein PhoU [Thermoanaerobaculia bacterium]|nr:phosphate signaling complex protein PhoU [Thermoanaerobaculia bacterium]
MKEHFSERLETLRRQLIAMGAEAERQIASAIEALVTGDAAKARAVIEGDKVVDQMEIKIDEGAVELLATQQPVAGDLRLLVSALKINADLERIGDHAVNIAEAAERMSKSRPFKPWIDIPYMAEIARGMLQDSLDAFVRRDAALALAVCKRDDLLDEKNKSIIRELLTYMAENPTLITACIEIIGISRNLERVGDLATNIGEETIYIAQGDVIKHHMGQRPSEPAPDA